MGLRKLAMRWFIVLSLSLTANAFANWNEPVEMISGTWGGENIQFGLEHGDTSDTFPNLQGILGNGSIIIDDIINERTEVYSSYGIFQEIVPWNKINKPTGGIIFTKSKYRLGCCKYGYKNNNLIIGDGNVFQQIDNLGNTVQAYTTRPPELGLWNFTCKSGFKTLSKCNRLHFDIEYPDAGYIFEVSKADYKSSLEKQVKIGNNLIVDNQGKSVYAYGVTSTIPATESRKEKRYLGWNATWQKPEDDYEDIPRGQGVEPKTIIHAQYGDPIIGPDGSIYCWMRSDINYKIIKWTWNNGQ